MKIPNFFKRTAALVLAAVSALTVIPPGVAYAAEPEKIGSVTARVAKDSDGNAILYNGDATFEGRHVGGKGKEKYRLFVDGYSTFCVEPGASLHNGSELKQSSSAVWDALSADKKQAIGLTLLYGSQGNRDILPGSKDEGWLGTQIIIWEYIMGCRETSGSFKRLNTTACDVFFGENYPNKGVEKAYNYVANLLARHNTIPSFMAKEKNKVVKELTLTDGKRSITLTDENKMLAEYDFSTSDKNVTVSKNGNTLTITASKDFDGKVLITASRNNLPSGDNTCRLMAYGDTTLQDVIVGADDMDTVVAYMSVEAPSGGLALKKVSDDGMVEGVTFTVKGNGVEKTVTTGKDGFVNVTGLFPGTYTITEQTIDRYEPQEPQTVTVEGGKTATVTFSNKLKRGSLEVIKTAEDKFIEGVKFHLFGKSYAGTTVDEYAVTDKNGLAKFSNIPISGETPYTLEEVGAGEQYTVPDKLTAPIEWNKVTKRSLNNSLKKFRVNVVKKDADGTASQGEGSLAGAVYGIYKGDTLIDRYTTDKDGKFTTSYYTCDTDWTLREISAPVGYTLDKTVYNIGSDPKLFTLTQNTVNMEVKETAAKGSIAIIKHTDDGSTGIETPEKGAKFQIYLKSAGDFNSAKTAEKDTLICDKNGYAKSKDLPYGLYTVHQVSGWEGRDLIADFDVFIKNNSETYSFLINNANFRSFLRVVKKDSETGKTIPYAGAGFQIYNPSGKRISMKLTYPEVKTIDTFYTSSDGTLTTPQSLEYGKGYKLVEVQAPYGYVLDSTPISFDVTKENAKSKDDIPVIEVVRTNIAQKGTITVTKNGEVFSSVSEAKGIYQPIYAVKGLSGAVFTITAAEDIVTPDGTTRVKKGTLVDTITTDAKGSAKSKQLYLGKYEVKEITAPTGFVLSGKVKTVELTYAGQDVKVTSTATEFTNLRQKVEIELKKGLEIDELYGIGTNGEIFDISFGLYAAEKLTAADGKTIPKDGLIEILFLSDEGRSKAKTDLPIGSYYVKEIAANSAYVVSSVKFPINFAYAGQEKATVSIKVNDGNSIANKIIYGSVKGKKTDEDGNALGGAVIGIFKVGTEKYTERTAIQTATSAEDGSFGFEKVPYGTWIVREIAAPTGFVLSEEEFPVTVGKTEQVIEISMVNRFIKGNLALTKVDADYPENKLTGAEFEVFSDTDNDGELGENDLLLGLMAEGERGCYRMEELRYGRYFVREKSAPVGFVLDTKVYEVFISENGVTYFIQNKAGVGFINNAQKGSLKIQKRSTDKKVKGFSFRVTGDNGYDQVFKTDKNGEIFIEGLRIGEYRVSEVSDKVSAPYILPADETVDVKYNETTTIEMLNKNRDTPKTGDDFNSALWIGGAVSALAGAAALLFFGLRKRKKAE